MSYNSNCGCTETQQTTYVCGECQSPTPCECEVLDLSTNCIVFTGDTIQCQNVDVVVKNAILSVALKNIIDFFCQKLSEIANRFRIVNIGTGAKVYKQENLLGQKELRTITSSDTSVTIIEGTTTIDITVPDYPIVPTASNIGTGAGVFKELSTNDYKFRKIKTENSGAGVTILKAQVENTNDISIIGKTLTSTDSSVVITSTTDSVNLSVVAVVPPDGSETKVTAGTNVTVTGNGTIATPYVVNSTDTNTTYSAGTAMSLVGTTFNNTAPDQVVTLTQGGATTITGTYPNFTITSTDTNTIADGSETKITDGLNTTITGLGTIGSPYQINVPTATSVQSAVVSIGTWSTNWQTTVSTTLASGKNILSITPFLECTTANNGYLVGDILTVSTPENNDSGGLSDGGIGVQFNNSNSTSMGVVVNDRVVIQVNANGSTGVAGQPFTVTTYAQWAIRLVIIYI
jgi:hypothetical protein